MGLTSPRPALTDVRTVPRKEVDKSFVWVKDDGGSAALDLMTRVNSALLFSLSYGLCDTYFPDISKSRLSRYLELRRLPDTEGAELVDEKRSCFSNIESAVFVRSIGKKTWEKGTYNHISITSLVKEDETDARKRGSLMSINVVCPCTRSGFERICRPSLLQRKIYGDQRRGNDLPGSFVTAVLCKHSCIGLDWLSTFHYAANFGMFGIYGQHAIGIANDVIEYVLKRNLKIRNHPDYDINSKINGMEIEGWGNYLSYWSAPLRNYIFGRF